MNKKILGIIALLSVLSVLGLAVVTPVLATNATPTVATPTPAAGDIEWKATPPPAYDHQKFFDAVSRVVNYLFGGVLVICAMFILLSAYIFITAGGAPEKVTKARQYLIYALVGLAVGVTVRGLMSFVGHLLEARVAI